MCGLSYLQKSRAHGLGQVGSVVVGSVVGSVVEVEKNGVATPEPSLVRIAVAAVENC